MKKVVKKKVVTEVVEHKENLSKADGFLFGYPTRFGMMPAQMKAFFDSTGDAWYGRTLIGKPAGLFFSTNTLGGGQETTAFTAVTQLAHHGMTFVPLGYAFHPEKKDKNGNPVCDVMNTDEVHGGGPWGAGCIAKTQNSPTELELDMAYTQGYHFGKYVLRLHH